ncbi:MAG: tRNA (N(6)-L-threonylcarbamoyladenosine(37)-C(2))-methylthiotransferase MtaB [Clostridia bacterium]|nr:tRNA (N(6)-L-threonylcarbamoyladenosine(37)-C(2))-methylthiotransferase MtaB [Clostridia bacterium]
MTSFPEYPRAAILTLGCRVNQYESDVIAGALEADGFDIVPIGQRADVTIVNTCTVTAESDRKSRQQIRRAAAFSPGAPLIVTGCFAQVSPEAAAAIEGVSAVVGNADKAEIAALARCLLHQRAEAKNMVSDIMTAPYDNMILQTPRRCRSYIKIEDGCENRCAYCIIPAARGRVRSKAPEIAAEEARRIAESGCREIILTGIETAAYGRDSGGAFSLGSLIAELDRIPGIERIGLGSLDPSLMRDPFLTTLASLPTVLPHFHLSLQSGSSSVLRRMRRPYNAAQAMDRIEALRRLFYEVMLTTDVIVGFPGETEEEFAETVEFCRQAKFLHLHIFPYSVRKDTEAAAMKDQLPEAVKKSRAAALASVQREIKADLLREYTEKHRESPVRVLVEEEEDGLWLGHTEHYAEVKFRADSPEVGSVMNVILTETDGNVCFGEAIE